MVQLLDIRHLTLKAGEKILCHDVSFSIEKNEVIGILGPNGCGKTTLLLTLAGLLHPAKGNITLDGKILHQLPRKTLAQHIGILLQQTHDLFPQSVWDICASGRYPHQKTMDDHAIIQHALDIMELSHKSHAIIQSLSGGERKRLSIATLLAQAPTIFLLDEPTNHLDLRHQIRVLNHVVELTKNQSATVIMSLHDVNLAARFCQKILLFLPDGSILIGATRDILTVDNISLAYAHPMQHITSDELSWYQPS